MVTPLRLVQQRVSLSVFIAMRKHDVFLCTTVMDISDLVNFPYIKDLSGLAIFSHEFHAYSFVPLT